MDLRQLKYFVAVVEARSVTDASRRLHVVQPAVSQRLAALEQELGVQLLVRARSGVTPTAAGTELYARAKTIVKQVAAAEAATREKGGAIAGRVSIGLLRSVSRYAAAPLFRELRARHADIVPEVVIGYSADLIASVDATRLDIAMRVSGARERVVGEVLFTEALCLVGTPQFLAGKRPEIDLHEVGDIPLLVAPAQPVHVQLERAARESGIAFNIVGSIEASEALAELCLDGYAATFMPETAAAHLLASSDNRLSAVHVRGFERTVSIYSHPEVPKSPSVEACEKTLANVLRRVSSELRLIPR